MPRSNSATAEERRAARRAMAEAVVARAHLESVLGTAQAVLELRDLADATRIRPQVLLALGSGRRTGTLTTLQLQLLADAMLRLAALPR